MTRTPWVPMDQLPAFLPGTPIPDSVSADEVVQTCIGRLEKHDHSVWHPQAYWRDLLALTSNMRTFYSASVIEAAWGDVTATSRPSGFAIVPGTASIERMPGAQCVGAKVGFDVEIRGRGGKSMVGRGLAILRAVDVGGGDWKIWTLSTLLESVEGLGDPDVFPDEMLSGAKEAGRRGAVDVLIVGAGPAGLATLARMKSLGVDAVAVDKYEAVGMSWTERYKSLRLHTPKMMNCLPFNFYPGKHVPELMGVQDLREMYEGFVQKYELDDRLWMATTVKTTSWSENTKTWTVKLTSQGKESTVEAKHVVFAIGFTGRLPNMPTLEGKEQFQGEILHASEYVSSDKWAGKKAIVVGSANTGHDVAVDMVNAGVDVTMTQRNKTTVIPLASLPLNRMYHENANVKDADIDFMSRPIPVTRLMLKNIGKALPKLHKAKFDALEKAGFRLDLDADLARVLYETLGGHYLDIGGSDLIGEGKIKVKSGSSPVSFSKTAMKFEDGSEMEADVVVFATGYETNMRVPASELVSADVAEKLDDVWRLDDEAQPRGAWKPIDQPNFWYCPGDLALSRFHSRFVALQVKAELQGNAFEPYKKRFSKE
ncbi:flavin-containing monooxygenase [Polyplosphaeria fusca]|uniref:Flavin-containing monooxygenase n=1 Tax=Polyplosphaeria fusca TaxID=682080 RepID=A0A9P4V245_9PLEO|nr:flavin-containing monooxygenase [Polyplosphaeria fusca]